MLLKQLDTQVTVIVMHLYALLTDDHVGLLSDNKTTNSNIFLRQLVWTVAQHFAETEEIQLQLQKIEALQRVHCRFLWFPAD